MNDKPDSNQPDYVVKGFKPSLKRGYDMHRHGRWFKGSCALCHCKDLDVKFVEDGVSAEMGNPILISLCRECYR